MFQRRPSSGNFSDSASAAKRMMHGLTTKTLEKGLMECMHVFMYHYQYTCSSLIFVKLNLFVQIDSVSSAEGSTSFSMFRDCKRFSIQENRD